MNNIKVTLLHHTPLYIASDGARTCWSSQDKSDTTYLKKCGDCESTNINSVAMMCNECESERIDIIKTIGPKDLALLDRVGNQYHHGSILEHVSFNFFIDGISRACLQELARHRLASLSVKSSRYTLKELKDEPAFIGLTSDEDDSHTTIAYDYKRASKYILMTDSDNGGAQSVDRYSVDALDNLRLLIVNGTSNDKAKYCMPESYRTQLTWSINMRSLQNFLSLRTDKKALPEIQHLARLIYEALPAEAQSLVKYCVKLEQE